MISPFGGLPLLVIEISVLPLSALIFTVMVLPSACFIVLAAHSVMALERIFLTSMFSGAGPFMMTLMPMLPAIETAWIIESSSP